MPNLLQINLSVVIQGCEEESGQPYQNEVGYCFELFRRALEQRDEFAWTALQKQYARLIQGWIQTRAFNTMSTDEREDVVQETWTRFWRTLTRYTAPLALRFKHTGALLSYLNKCVFSATIDYQRRVSKHKRLQSRLERESADLYTSSQPSIERQLINQQKLEALREWIATHVTDHQERLILKCSFEDGLKPQEIVSQHPNAFPNVRTVYRVKERILKRARRAFEMSIF